MLYCIYLSSVWMLLPFTWEILFYNVFALLLRQRFFFLLNASLSLCLSYFPFYHGLCCVMLAESWWRFNSISSSRVFCFFRLIYRLLVSINFPQTWSSSFPITDQNRMRVFASNVEFNARLHGGTRDVEWIIHRTDNRTIATDRRCST